MRFPRPSRPPVTGRREMLRRPWQPPSDRFRQLLSDYLEPRLLCARRQAMACDFEFRLPDTHRRHLKAAQAALDLVDRLEERLSVYRDESEISRVNRRGGQGPVPVGPDLFAVLQEAVAVSRQTGGAFDPTSGSLSRVWGFLARKGRQPGGEEIRRLQSRVGCGLIHLDAGHRTVGLQLEGVELNLGGIGKGYALDRAAALMKRAGVEDALLHAGFSSVVALGSAPRATSRPGWPVGIRHPLRPGKDFAILHLVGCGMGTSGLNEQRYVVNGEVHGHIVDPRTGYPARGKTLVSAIAPTAARADALSTAFFVMELDEIRRYCEDHSDVGAVVVDQDSGSAESIRLHRFGRVNDWLEVLD